MKSIFKPIAIAAVLLLSYSSCKKDDSSPTYQEGEIGLDIANIIGTENLDASGITTYTNAAGENFTVTKFKYYLSNFELIKSDGSTFIVPESYYLIDEADVASFTPILPNIPGGEYSGVKFMIGVDSAHNVSGAQTGALDPANLMFWSWSSGYIFLKLEGTSPVSPMGDFTYHIGGFASPNAAMRTVTMNFNGDKLIVDGTREAEVHMMVDLQELFKNPDTLSIATINMIMSPGADAMMIATNYQDMFTFDHIHNGN